MIDRTVMRCLEIDCACLSDDLHKLKVGALCNMCQMEQRFRLRTPCRYECAFQLERESN